MPLFQAIAVPAINPIRLLAPAQLRVEADLIRVAVETLHPTASQTLGRGGLLSRGRELTREAEFAGDTATWFRAISRYLASVRSERTFAEWPERVTNWRKDHPSRLPIRLEVIDGRLSVAAVLDKASVAPGDELLELEGRRAGDLLKTILPWVSADGRAAFSRESALGATSGLGGNGLDRFGPIFYGLNAKVRARFRKAGTLTLPTITDDLWSRAFGPRADMPPLTITRPHARVAVVRVTELESTAWTTDFLRAEFQGLDQGGRVILDLRDVWRASPQAARTLMSFLAPSAVSFASEAVAPGAEPAERLKPYLTSSELALRTLGAEGRTSRPEGGYRLVNHESAGPIPPDEGAFRGQLDVLIGERNGPGVAMMLVGLRRVRPFRTIGQATGGTIGGMDLDEDWQIRLPSSGIVVHIPAIHLVASKLDAKRMREEGFMPDVRMRSKPGEEVDTVLRWVIEHPVPTGSAKAR